MSDVQERIKAAAEQHAAQAKRRAIIESREKEVRAAIGRVAKTEEGKTMLRAMHDMCGFVSPSMAMDKAGEAALMHTSFHEGQRAVYLALRSAMEYDDIIEIERPRKENDNV